LVVLGDEGDVGEVTGGGRFVVEGLGDDRDAAMASSRLRPLSNISFTAGGPGGCR
jgi:hypothetical protein